MWDSLFTHVLETCRFPIRLTSLLSLGWLISCIQSSIELHESESNSKSRWITYIFHNFCRQAFFCSLSFSAYQYHEIDCLHSALFPHFCKTGVSSRVQPLIHRCILHLTEFYFLKQVFILWNLYPPIYVRLHCFVLNRASNITRSLLSWSKKLFKNYLH